MRTRITTDYAGHVTLEYDDPYTGERETVEYFVGGERGYVRIMDRAGRYPQVCERLASTGRTLRCRRDKLADVIRREYRAMRRDWAS